MCLIYQLKVIDACLLKWLRAPQAVAGGVVVVCGGGLRAPKWLESILDLAFNKKPISP